MSLRIYIGSMLVFTFLFCSCSHEQKKKTNTLRLTNYVDLFIGTADHGHVYPGATVPFGSVQLSPDNGTAGWDWCSGYNWEDDTIVGFSHTHLSGTGIGDLYDVSMMPTLGKIDFSKKTPPKESSYAASFSHANEKASPGYYAVQLDNGLDVELTATGRVGFHHYQFPKEAESTGVLIDLGFALNWDTPLETALSVKGNKVVGHRHSTGWARDQRVYFAIEFSREITSFQIADSTSSVAENIDWQNNPNDQNLVGKTLRAQFNFGETSELFCKVGISSANEEGAIAALQEIPDWDFEKIKSNASNQWERELSKIKVSGMDESLKTIFYTSLYRTYLAPIIFSDALGNYKASTSGSSTNWEHTPFYPEGASIKSASDYTRYDLFSLWDTFRAANPLLTITQQNRINNIIRSFLDHYDEYGLLPVWSLLGNETNTMTGYHAVPIIVDAYLKGYRDYDVPKAFEAMKKSAMQDIRGTQFLREYGYIPHDKTGQSVTRTLEYAFDDWCIAQMAKALGKKDDYEAFMKRAANYRNLFDPSTGFMRAKLSDNSWKIPFDPQYSSHDFAVAEYTEGNAWQHSWFVPHDVKGLINLHQGNENFARKLDSLFMVSSEITGDNVSADISGLIGQYAHGNEPSHHIAYLYNYAGMPWKTQERVRDICDSQYNDTPAGLCGNEDCGQMSAWYVFSTLGFYPVNPSEGIYVIGSPAFDQAVMEVGDGKQFKIVCHNVSAENIYIQSATLNDKPLTRSYIIHEELMAGGKLEFEMGNAPNKSLWNNEESLPPSMTRN